MERLMFSLIIYIFLFQKCFHICEQIMISLTNSLVPLSGSHNILVTPTQKSLAGQLLKFALLLDKDYEKLVKLLFDKTKTDTRDGILLFLLYSYVLTPNTKRMLKITHSGSVHDSVQYFRKRCESLQFYLDRGI